MKQIALALAALALTPSLLAAPTSTIDGTWKVTGDVQGRPVNPECTLAQKDGKITGTCQGTDGKPVSVSGTITDKGFKWQYETLYQGDGITIYFTGSFDKEDHLKGGIYVEPYAVDGTFIATRGKSAPPAPSPAAPPQTAPAPTAPQA